MREFSKSIFHLLSSILVFLVLTGCGSQTGPDANTHVFRTAEQEAVARRARLAEDWVSLAAKINNAERPDARTIVISGKPLALQVSADGVTRDMDMSPLAERLAASTGKEREPIRAWLAGEMSALDRERLKRMGFDKAKELLYPMLVSGRQLGEVKKSMAEAPLAREVVIDLNWLPVAKWPGTEAWTAIEPGVVKSWNTTADVVLDSALANIKRDFVVESAKQPVFDTVELPGLGRYGQLRADMDPGFALLPEFLTGVRRAWGMEDDLVLLLPARTSVTFVERKNTKLLDRMLPEWSKRFETFSDPLLLMPVHSSERGFTLLNYKPAEIPGAGKPASKPATGPTTKPKVYIVN